MMTDQRQASFRVAKSRQLNVAPYLRGVQALPNAVGGEDHTMYQPAGDFSFVY